MRESPVSLLIVEDDMIIAAKISMLLANLGYDVAGVVPRGEEALRHCEDVLPDIVLMDINLKGALDGIATARALHEKTDVPIIYITANADEATFNRAKETRPYAFISKPVKNLDLQRAVELTVSRMAENRAASAPLRENEEEAPVILNDRIFVRHKEKLVKISLEEILYIEAERNYCRIFTKTKEYMLSAALKALEDKLSPRMFIRVHRSFMVNLAQIEEVGENSVVIAHKTIPLSTASREELLKRIQTI